MFQLHFKKRMKRFIYVFKSIHVYNTFIYYIVYILHLVLFTSIMFYGKIGQNKKDILDFMQDMGLIGFIMSFPLII